jgi:hypothetical protein
MTVAIYRTRLCPYRCGYMICRTKVDGVARMFCNGCRTLVLAI